MEIQARALAVSSRAPVAAIIPMAKAHAAPQAQAGPDAGKAMLKRWRTGSGAVQSIGDKEGDLVELRGIEPLTSSLRTMRSPN